MKKINKLKKNSDQIMEENLKFRQIEELNKCTFSPCLSRKASSLKKYINI